MDNEVAALLKEIKESMNSLGNLSHSDANMSNRIAWLEDIIRQIVAILEKQNG